MKKTIYISLALLLTAIMVFLLFHNKQKTEKRVYQYDENKPADVQTMVIKPSTRRESGSYSGIFEPERETKLSSEIQGKVSQVLTDQGMFVNKGSALVLLDKTFLELQLKNADIQIEGLENDVKRYAILSAADAIQGVQREKSELALRSARVQKETIAEQINKSTVRAPFSGVITAKLTEAGSFAAPGVPLFQLTDISSLRFTINVSEEDLIKFTKGGTYRVAADVYPELELSAKVEMIGSKANPGNSFAIQFRVVNTKDLKLKAGMFGKIEIKNIVKSPEITIPASAITGTSLQPKVYVLEKGRAVKRSVTISSRYQSEVALASGLKEGDVLITAGFINLFDGARAEAK